METLRELDVLRAASLRTTLRADQRAEDDETSMEDNGLGVMEVRFSPFNVWYEIDSWYEGKFLERTVKGAFKRTIAAHHAALNEDAHRVTTLFNHGMGMDSRAELVLGDITDLREDNDSAVLEANLHDTSLGRDLLPGLRAGSYGSSFMFRVVQDEWNDDPGTSDWNPKGIPERTIKEVRLFEAGPVTFPANPDATAGMRAVRSMTDEYYKLLESRDPQRVDAMRSRVLELRTPNVEPATGTSTDGPAKPTDPDPALSHSGGLTSAQRARVLRELTHTFLKETG